MTNVDEQFAEFSVQMEHLTQKLDTLDDQADSLQSALVALNDLPQAKEVLIPIADGVHVRATINNPSDVIIKVGKEIAVEKDVVAARTLLEKQLDVTVKYQEALTQKLLELSRKADQLESQQKNV
ncbi:MAG: prefoldin alpha subunit [Candidatus Woesearchaeota archaeon]|jgi:prefoldin alpha subunit